LYFIYILSINQYYLGNTTKSNRHSLKDKGRFRVRKVKVTSEVKTMQNWEWI